MRMAHPTTVHVVATSVDGTRAALKATAPLAREHDARLVVLIPKRVEDDAMTADSDRSTNWQIARYEGLARELEQPIQIRVCYCWDPAEVAMQLTPPDATMVIGGPAKWFWPGPEERIADRLRQSGREVLFVGCNS